MASLLLLVRSALGLTFLFATLWLSTLLVRRFLPAWGLSARWAATLFTTLWLQHGLLIALGAFHFVHLSLFRWYLALPIMVGLALLAHWRLDGAGGRSALREDLGLAAGALREIAKPWLHRLLILWAGLAAGARALAGIVSPPLTWDTLTYHALKPAEWVQYGHQVRTLAPDQWGYYTFYPDAAEVPGAWALLFLQGDLGLPWVGVVTWAACAFAVYALARALQAQRHQAFRAAVLVAFLPALLGEMVSGYADMFVLLAFLALALFLVRLFQQRGAAEALLLGAAAGLLASAKWSGVPLAGLALVFSLLAPGAAPNAIARGRAFLLSLAAAVLMAGPHYLGVWMDSGSPFYPYTVRLGSHLLSAGHPQLQALFTGQLGITDPRWASPIVLLQSLVRPFSLPKVEFVGFGPALLLLVPLGGWGLALTAKRAPDRRARLLSALALLVLGLAPMIGLMSKDFAGQRAMWLPNLGRLLLPLPAVLAVLGACVQRRAATVFLLLALLLTLPMAWPAGVGNPMLDAISSLGPWLALSLCAGAALLVAFARIPRLKARLEIALPAAVGLTAIILIMPLARVRQEARYTIYEAAAAPNPTFIMQFTWPQHASAWPLWRALDDGSPHRIHASFGWDRLGHNGLRYPLLGSQLQNRVLYVPITRGAGPIIDYQNADSLRQEADVETWIARLRAANIDRVFFGHPLPLEAKLAARRPEHFQLLARGQGNLHALYRFIP